jgi:hypothetical protein
MAFDRGLAREIGLTPKETAVFAKLSNPGKIQDFITNMPSNTEPDGDTCYSVRVALRQNCCHCIEGAFIAACALMLHGAPALLMDFQARGDDDHVLALFRRGRFWGAISKSNSIWLRWRDPVYRSPRELAMSYFHEYVWRANKSLRRYSRPFDLRRFDPAMWVTNKDNCWDIAEALDECRHYTMITAAQARMLRARDRIEVEAGKFLEFKAPDRKTAMRY